jgi:hypothetical protein
MIQYIGRQGKDPGEIATTPIASSGGTAMRRFLQTELRMQNPHTKFRVLFIDHDGDLYLGGRNHANVDAIVGERLEHATGDARMGTHTHTNN